MPSRKLAVALVLLMLGLASWDAVLENAGRDDGGVRATFAEGGIPRPPAD